MNTKTTAPRFVLFGIQGVYNYGTESIVRGIEITLRAKWPACEILYVSRKAAYDQERLADTNVQVIPRDLSPRTIKWLVNGILKKITLRRLSLTEDISWAQNADCVVSIGGDLYTLPPGFHDQVDQEFRSPLVDVSERLLALNIPLVIWGSSIGPFDEWPSARDVFKNHLHNVSQIQVREPWTIEYLRTIGITENVVFAADPAFLTPTLDYPLVRKQPDLPLVGVNLSPLSIRYVMPGESPQTVIERQAEVISSLIRKHQVEVILLPHVVSAILRSDDDRRYLKTIFDHLVLKVPDHVQIVTDDPGARKMKGILKQCDIVVAARMHCCIHAASVGTPPLFLSYSKKSLGMSRFIYGHQEYCAALDQFGSDEVDILIRELLENRTSLKDDLLEQSEQIRQQALQAAEYVREAMNSNVSEKRCKE